MPETLDAWQLASNDVVQDPIEQATHESDTLYAEDHLEAIGPIALIALPGTEAFANKVNAHLVQRRQEDLANNSHLEEQRGYFRKITSLTVKYNEVVPVKVRHLSIKRCAATTFYFD